LPSFRSTSCKEISSSIEDLEATFSLATNAIHMDDRYAGPDVAPAMHPSTT
jgi:cystathionine beta-lyase